MSRTARSLLFCLISILLVACSDGPADETTDAGVANGTAADASVDGAVGSEDAGLGDAAETGAPPEESFFAPVITELDPIRTANLPWGFVVFSADPSGGDGEIAVVRKDDGSVVRKPHSTGDGNVIWNDPGSERFSVLLKTPSETLEVFNWNPRTGRFVQVGRELRSASYIGGHQQRQGRNRSGYVYFLSAATGYLVVIDLAEGIVDTIPFDDVSRIWSNPENGRAFIVRQRDSGEAYAYTPETGAYRLVEEVWSSHGFPKGGERLLYTARFGTELRSWNFETGTSTVVANLGSFGPTFLDEEHRYASWRTGSTTPFFDGITFYDFERDEVVHKEAAALRDTVVTAQDAPVFAFIAAPSDTTSDINQVVRLDLRDGTRTELFEAPEPLPPTGSIVISANGDSVGAVFVDGQAGVAHVDHGVEEFTGVFEALTSADGSTWVIDYYDPITVFEFPSGNRSESRPFRASLSPCEIHMKPDGSRFLIKRYDVDGTGVVMWSATGGFQTLADEQFYGEIYVDPECGSVQVSADTERGLVGYGGQMPGVRAWDGDVVFDLHGETGSFRHATPDFERMYFVGESDVFGTSRPLFEVESGEVRQLDPVSRVAYAGTSELIGWLRNGNVPADVIARSVDLWLYAPGIASEPFEFAPGDIRELFAFADHIFFTDARARYRIVLKRDP